MERIDTFDMELLSDKLLIFGIDGGRIVDRMIDKGKEDGII